MNPQYTDAPGLHLPQPTPGGQGVAAPGAVQPHYGPAAGAVPIPPAPSVSSPGQGSGMPPVAATSPMQAAEDNNTVLDDEWVGKARDIIAQYQSDPYTRSRELSKVKAQYMKIRYNKDIKVSEDA